MRPVPVPEGRPADLGDLGRSLPCLHPRVLPVTEEGLSRTS